MPRSLPHAPSLALAAAVVAYYGSGMSQSESPGAQTSYSAEVLPASTSHGGSRLLTRREAARVLGISETTLRRRELEGLTPIVRDGVHVFEETVVRQFVTTMSRRRVTEERSPDGGTAAEVFALLRQGVAPRDVVEQLRVPPSVVARLVSEWASLGSGVYLPGEMAKDLGVATPADILAKLANATKRENDAALAGPQCCNCRVKAAAYCPECARGEGEP